MNISPLFKSKILVSILTLLGACQGFAQNLPNPSEEAKLYEAAKKEGTVVWYGGAPLDPMRAMADDFMAKYPGVKVEILRLVGVAQYQKFMQETQAKQYIADVLHIGDRPSMVDLVDKELVANWKIPSYDMIPDDAKIKTHSYTAYIIDSTIAYNPTKLTAEEVKILSSDWKGLTDPRFKGRIAMSSQFSGGSIATIQMFLSPKYKDRYGMPFLKALAAQKIKIYNDVIIPPDRVVAGEQDIAIFPSEGSLSALYLKGAPIRWIHPKPTSAFGNTWFAVSKFSPHPNAARLFVNWIMSAEGAVTVQQKYNGIPVYKNSKDQRKVAQEKWYMPITERFIPDWDSWAKGDAEKDFEMWVKMMREGQ
jgi:iron(III) transport system substrate-binding protein